MKNIIKNKTLLGIILFTLFTFLSCEDYLEVPLPTNSLAAEGTFKEKVLINKLMLDVYYNYKENVAARDWGLRAWELTSDDAYNPSITDNTRKSLQEVTHLPDDYSYYLQPWAPSYKVIFLCNLMLENLPTVDATVLTENEKNAYIAAAKTIRADTYFHLVQVYGGVPLVLSTDTKEIEFLGRNTEESVYDQIETDLLEAIAALPASKGPAYFINCKFIPQSILARVYLTNEKWEQAEAAASAVINSGNYILDADLNDVFLQRSPSTIFATGYTVDFYGNASVTADPGGWTTQPMGFAIGFGQGAFPALSEDLLLSFEAGDMRKVKWVKLINTRGYPNDNNRMWQNKYKYSSLLGVLPAAGREDDNKYIRLAELYLIRAEARVKKTGPDLTGATNDLNIIRNRAGLANTTATTQGDLANAIIHERRVELFFENGTRWFDLVRLGIADQVLSALPYKTGWKPYKVHANIPLVDLQANPNLTPTPGW